MQADAADEAATERFFAEVDRRLGPVTALVNNAGITGKAARTWELTRADLEGVLAVNLVAPFLWCRAVMPGILRRRYGRVVNVSSQAGQLASMSTYAPAYSISKAALNAFTRQLAAATQGRNVLVNSANPGWVRTDMGGPGAPRSVEQGADTIVWLATLPAKGPTGGFFSDRKAIDW
jgi:NAD(P)-dependent dehydrogenase (short-subunit alcohol dehydrogenase family)